MRKPVPPATTDWVFPPNPQYAYFEGAADHPFEPAATALSPVNAWWLADAALLAYAEADFAVPAFQGAGLRVEGAQPFTGASTQCYVAHTERFAIVAFRGTQVHKPGDTRPLPVILRNVIADIYTDARFVFTAGPRGTQVHRGFQDGLAQVWEQRVAPHLTALRRRHPDMAVWFTGHSLGAALATLAAERWGQARGLYTYGSPRVGDVPYARGYPLGNVQRFVNHNDIVTRVPPEAKRGLLRWLRPVTGSYAHVGALHFIDADGAISEPDVDVERLSGLLRYALGQLLRSVWRSDPQVPALMVDPLIDHSPVYYAVHLWNAYVAGLEAAA